MVVDGVNDSDRMQIVTSPVEKASVVNDKCLASGIEFLSSRKRLRHFCASRSEACVGGGDRPPSPVDQLHLRIGDGGKEEGRGSKAGFS